jgi:hypothetical protein
VSTLLRAKYVIAVLFGVASMVAFAVSAQTDNSEERWIAVGQVVQNVVDENDVMTYRFNASSTDLLMVTVGVFEDTAGVGTRLTNNTQDSIVGNHDTSVITSAFCLHRGSDSYTLEVWNLDGTPVSPHQVSLRPVTQFVCNSGSNVLVSGNGMHVQLPQGKSTGTAVNMPIFGNQPDTVVIINPVPVDENPVGNPPSNDNGGGSQGIAVIVDLDTSLISSYIELGLNPSIIPLTDLGNFNLQVLLDASADLAGLDIVVDTVANLGGTGATLLDLQANVDEILGAHLQLLNEEGQFFTLDLNGSATTGLLNAEIGDDGQTEHSLINVGAGTDGTDTGSIINVNVANDANGGAVGVGVGGSGDGGLVGAGVGGDGNGGAVGVSVGGSGDGGLVGVGVGGDGNGGLVGVGVGGEGNGSIIGIGIGNPQDGGDGGGAPIIDLSLGGGNNQPIICIGLFSNCP